ncbi:MAG TPA: response regulator [Verrucomicrobiae bacterium]|jgi:HD-like signal output (HDOD) protein
MKKRILFVGEDQALCREFQAREPGPDCAWSVQHTANEEEALALCQRQSIAAVVADVNLQGKSGTEVLDSFMRRQPKALRIVISDLADVESTMKCIGHAHHHVLKPCSAQTLFQVLEEAFAQETWLPSEPVQGLIAQMRQVPSPLKAYTQIVEEMKSPDCSLEKIGQLIAQDPAVTAKVLQLANSAVFGLELNIVHPVEAISYIGLETTKAVVLLAHTFSSFDHLKLVRFSIEDLWRHSVEAGRMARHIAEMEKAEPEVAEQSFVAGLLHDIGKLLFAANHAGLFGKVLRLSREQQCNLWEAEAQVLPGVGHAELGATVLGIWGLPKSITEAVALHHVPWRDRCREFSPLTAVHVANILDHEKHPDLTIIMPSQINTSYLKDRGLAGRVDEWRQGCLNQKH